MGRPIQWLANNMLSVVVHGSGAGSAVDNCNTTAAIGAGKSEHRFETHATYDDG